VIDWKTTTSRYSVEPGPNRELVVFKGKRKKRSLGQDVAFSGDEKKRKRRSAQVQKVSRLKSAKLGDPNFVMGV
jgi:hypothetical protein